MSGIFLSYRRDDSSGWAGRLHEHLIREWGPGQVFMDIDAIAPGEDFRHAIARTIRTSDVVLVVIGPSWANSRDRAGNRRLDDEGDTHRAEVAAALASDVRVVPILVGGAAMPKLEDLPTSLKDLAYRNAAIIDDRRFASDVRALQEALKQFAEALAAERAAEDAKRVAEREEAVRRAEEEARRVAEREEAVRRAEEEARRVAEREEAAHRAKPAEPPGPLSPLRLPPPPPPPPAPPSGVPWAGAPVAFEPRLASWGDRIGAALIDGTIQVLLLVPAFVYMGAGPTELEPCTDGSAGLCEIPTDATVGIGILFGVLGLTIWGAYKVTRDGSPGGQTVGKRAVGIRVVDARTGGPIGRSKAAGRTLAQIGMEVFSCGILLIVELLFPLWDNKRQMLHDKVVGTVVVRTSPGVPMR
jgi:uncharacterized RDD family membrane protein YckC